MSPRRILIFFSDTGGGHRAAANALRDAFQFTFPERYEIRLVDGFKECAPFPFNLIPRTYYPLTTYAPRLWGDMFHTSNSQRTLPISAWFDDLLLRPGCRRVIAEYAPALVISVHPLINRAPCNALKQLEPQAPFVTVVTDLFDAHGMWFSAAAADLIIVPTRGAYARALEWHIPPAKLRVIGQPIALKFAMPAETAPNVLRAQLGLQPDLFTILLIGGGEGMGPLGAIAHALDETRLPIQLVIIAGRNEKLRAQLADEDWQTAVNVQGFVTNMPDWMRASDLIITKAGPGTIMETLAAGKPMILSGFLRGQEEGNVTFVQEAGVGVVATTPEAIAAQVRAWLTSDGEPLKQMQERARRAARPDAAIEIARAVDGLLSWQRDLPPRVQPIV